MEILRDEFVAWSRSRENNRAPGGTCLRGCSNLARGAPWRSAGVGDSKGCGAAMRAAPIGLYFFDDLDALVRVAAAQSSLTHRHPTGIASSVAAAAAVAHVVRQGALEGIVEFTRARVEALDEALLVEVGCPEHLAKEIGNREMLVALDATTAALGQESEDVCALLGGAWIGEEAVATALWCALQSKGQFRDAVVRGANSSGDSDSIATIAGSIVGALVGVEGIDRAYVEGVEKSNVLDELARKLYETRHGADLDTTGESLDPFGAERLVLDAKRDAAGESAVEDEDRDDGPFDDDAPPDDDDPPEDEGFPEDDDEELPQ
jgi:ADP-ribosylglycohydrolase